MSDRNLKEIIEEDLDRLFSAGGMPQIPVTTLEKESKKNAPQQTFHTRVFAILEDETAHEYAKFINFVINSKNVTILREEQNWTKEGELIRVVDYIVTHKKQKGGKKMSLIKDGGDAIYKESLIQSLQSRINQEVMIRTSTDGGVFMGKIVKVSNTTVTIKEQDSIKNIKIDDIIDVV